MQDFQKRVVLERKELHDKIARLGEFLLSANFRQLSETNREEAERLVRQKHKMMEYREILDERIAALS